MNYYDQQQALGQQGLTEAPRCKICGRMICGANTIWNSYEEPCKCTIAERQQLTAEDVRRIVREEIAASQSAKGVE